jgi:lipopolysaccharide/colanic/teichoic acid biosynthesis glycosyltransferase
MPWLPETFVRGDGSVRRDWVAYTLALPFVDAAAAVAALALAYQARAGAGLGGAQLSMERYIALGALVMATWLLMLAALGLYDRERLLAGTEEYARVFQAGVALPVAVAFADFVLAAHLLSRDWLISFWPGMIVFAGAGRMLARMAVHAARRRGAFRARVIIVGVDARAARFAQHLTDSGYSVLGFFDDYRPVGARIGGGGWPVLGAVHDMPRASGLGADEVIIVPSAVSWESRRASLAPHVPRRFAVRVLADREDALTGHIRVSQRAGVPVYALGEMRLTGLEAAVKRAFDLTVAGALILCVGPFALARIAGRVAAGRVVFESHTLVGARARRIAAYTLGGGGSRVVSKLPAALAVLRGQMSIVGPVGMMDDGGVTPPELWMMKPGLTSAVWADRGSVDAASAMAIQIEYVRSYSIWRDLQVIWHRMLAMGRTGNQAVNTAAFWEIGGYAAKRVEQEI